MPTGLELLRRRHVADAVEGVPAHITLLYPFIAPDRLTPPLRGQLAEVAARHLPFEYLLVGRARWPDTIYVAVNPVRPFAALQADLADAFPDFPIYGGATGVEFVAHVKIAEGTAVDDPAAPAETAWRALPRRARATGIEVIARGDDRRWRHVWRTRLGKPPR